MLHNNSLLDSLVLNGCFVLGLVFTELSAPITPHQQALLTFLRWLKNLSFAPQKQPHGWGLRPQRGHEAHCLNHIAKKSQWAHFYLSHRCGTSSQCPYSHRWICSSLPYRHLDSCRGSFHTVCQAACYTKVWCQCHFGPWRSDVCPCFCRQWKGHGRSRHSRSWAWPSRARSVGWGWCGRWGVPPGTCHPQGRGSRSRHWLWMGSFCCSQRWCLCHGGRRGFHWLFLIWILEGYWYLFRNKSWSFFFMTWIKGWFYNSGSVYNKMFS